MSDNSIKKKPEIAQPKPDIILPDDNNVADFGSHAILRTPSPRNEVYQQTAPAHYPENEAQ